MKKQRGFTLIELMVVITIVSLLSSVVLTSLNSAKIRSQDSIRIQNLVTLRTALESYYADNGHYPITFTAPALPGELSSKLTECDNGLNYIPGLAPKYIAKLPSDPTLDCVGLTTYSWVYSSNGTDYKLITHPKENSFPQFMDDKPDGYWHGHYGIWSPGAATWGGL